jgi:hypothetical protein
MKYLEVIDNYNKDKVWCVKVYNRGEVYFNQKIKGNLLNSRYQRTNKKYLNEILERNINEIIANDEREEDPDEYMGQDGTLHTFEDINPYWEEQRMLDDYHYRVEKEIQDEIDDEPLPF